MMVGWGLGGLGEVPDGLRRAALIGGRGGAGRFLSLLLEECGWVGTELVVLSMAVGQMGHSLLLFQGRCPWLC